MKNGKRILSILLCVAVLMSLCACGRKETASGNTPKPANPVKVEKMKGTYTISEYLASGETIWYAFGSNKGKDTQPHTIYLLNPDGTMYFTKFMSTVCDTQPRYTLGELEHMEDREIAEMVRQRYIEAYARLGMEDLFVREREEVIDEIGRHIFSIMFRSTEFCRKPLDMEAVQTNLQIPAYREIAAAEWARVEEIYREWNGLYERLEDKNLVDMMVTYNGFVISSVFNEAIMEERLQEFRNYGISESDAQLWREVCAFTREKAAEIGENGYQWGMDVVEERKANAKPTRYRLSIVSDATGNHTAHMQLHFVNLLDSRQPVESLQLYWFEAPVDMGNSNMIVYDSQYNGYYMKKGQFYTRVNENIQLVLDQIGECDLPIDVKDINSLFE